MNAALASAGIFGALMVGNAGVFMASTYAQCSKTNIATSFKNGAIAASAPAIAYFLASYFEFFRRPFVDFFIGFGVQDPMATTIGLGYIVLLFLWPMTVWAVHNSNVTICVPDVDEMTKFKTDMLAKLNEKKKAQAANTNPQA
jgi:hypothetical protein